MGRQRSPGERMGQEAEQAGRQAERMGQQAKQQGQQAMQQAEQATEQAMQETEQVFSSAKNALENVGNNVDEQTKQFVQEASTRVDQIEQSWNNLTQRATGSKAVEALQNARADLTEDLQTVNQKLNQAGKNITEETRTSIRESLRSAEETIANARAEMQG